MKNLKTLFSFIFLALLISCGRNEPKEKEMDYPEATTAIPSNTTTKTNNTIKKSTESESVSVSDPETDSSHEDSGLATAIQRQIPNSNTSQFQSNQDSNPNLSHVPLTHVITEKNAEVIINSPLRNLLRNAEMGKSYTKSELIQKYKFPKEAVDLVKHVTCVGPNKLYFNWGSTWLVEKVSDAEFENDTMIFTFKKNKTYVSGGAIGIKYNKKIYTELILNNGSAYIPSVKGYHWEINK
ncbi:hypothetical protein [Flavobacterium aestivum]|uniref:hypothetical protein n=1 Tax=Flavobacterium aestivum TaxID=3003257 RepID=UPI0022861BD6|nr:hypothetical protein [Flavobacterium aestivum]